jgi:hypothetical protein
LKNKQLEQSNDNSKMINKDVKAYKYEKILKHGEAKRAYASSCKG